MKEILNPLPLHASPGPSYILDWIGKQD